MMQQVLSFGNSLNVAGSQQQRPKVARSQAFRPAVKAMPARRMSAPIRAAATPMTSQQSPFAAVDSEAALFAILKAGAAGGKVSSLHLDIKILNFYPHCVSGRIL